MMQTVKQQNTSVRLSLSLSQHYSYTHLSAGQLLREERRRPDSEFGRIVDSCFERGEFAPVEITIALLRRVRCSTPVQSCCVIKSSRISAIKMNQVQEYETGECVFTRRCEVVLWKNYGLK